VIELDCKRFNLGYLATRSARNLPDKAAVVDLAQGEPRVLSYRQLDDRLDRAAAAFQACGAPAGARVAMLIGNRYEYLEVMYGALRAGLIPVMVNTKQGPEALRETLEAAGTHIAVVDPACNEAALEVGRATAQCWVMGGGVGGQAAGGSDYERRLRNAADRPAPVTSWEERPAVLCYTSGSTGRPKGAIHSHPGRMLYYFLHGNVFKSMLGESIRSLVYLPIFHGNAAFSVGIAWETGGTVVIQPGFEPRAMLEVIEQWRINYFPGLAAVYMALLEHPETLRNADLSSLKYLMVGSAPSGLELLERTRAATGIPLVQTYGSTETGTALLNHPADGCPLNSCGLPFSGSEVKLVDSHTGAEGDRGELWIRNDWMAKGYWGMPELTAERFVGDWFRSGDILERDEKGHFYFQGRVDDRFNVAGQKVYPIEIEAVLQRHPDVVAAAVVSVPHDSKGEVPAAMVVRQHGSTLSEEQLKQFYFQESAAFSHPRRIVFVDSFPVGSTGKVDRAKIRDLMLSCGDRP
jgi:acyl-CoA synthetase (AMP-forming)/AMP-acid ligase II